MHRLLYLNMRQVHDQKSTNSNQHHNFLIDKLFFADKDKDVGDRSEMLATSSLH